MSGRKPDPVITARNQKIVHDYLKAQLTGAECAAKYGLSITQIWRILRNASANLDQAEWRRRCLPNLSSPESRRRRVQAVTVWPDCPEHLRAEYETLSVYMTRRAARAQLEERV